MLMDGAGSRQVPQRIIDGDTGSIAIPWVTIEPNASVEHRSDACAIGGRCDGWSAVR